MLQCMRRFADSKKRHPNLSNAFKYALSMCVTVFGAFNPDLSSTIEWSAYRVIWTVAYFSSTLYAWWWDICMDWSLYDAEVGGLRERRMLGEAWYYYAAAGLDLVLRFFWTYTLVPERDQDTFLKVGIALAPFAAMAEVARRTIWSVFRLENEHLNNAAGYRSVKHIPLHFDIPARPILNEESGSARRKIVLEVALYVALVVVVVVVAVI